MIIRRSPYHKDLTFAEGDLKKITVETKVPGKWIFVDIEEGFIYVWNSVTEKFELVPAKHMEALHKLMTARTEVPVVKKSKKKK